MRKVGHDGVIARGGELDSGIAEIRDAAGIEPRTAAGEE
jgi:hypothetical protein